MSLSKQSDKMINLVKLHQCLLLSKMNIPINMIIFQKIGTVRHERGLLISFEILRYVQNKFRNLVY